MYSDYWRLCRLINDSLPPTTESQDVSVSKEEEKRLLLVLSQVSREIKFSTSNVQKVDRIYLSDVVSRLISLLSVDSQFVQHLAGNVLLTLSEVVASSESGWDFFIHLLCAYMELVVMNILNCHFEPAAVHGESFGFIDAFRGRLKNVNWFTVAGGIRVLRNILKYLKQKCEDQLVEVYLDSVNSFLLNVPWDCMDEILYDRNGDKDCNTGDGSENEPKVLFLGNFIQFLCSLAEQVCSMETLGSTLDTKIMLSKIIDLVPKLLYWCLGKRGDFVSNHFRISQYLKHKLLVLMIRLSCQSCLDPSVFISWLKLLRSYFQEHLCKPITEVVEEDQSLDDSPFSSNISYREESNNSIHFHHIQRQAVFLFLRCSISLVNLKGEIETHSACSSSIPCLESEPIPDLSCCCCYRKKGLLEIYTWLSRHFPADAFADHEEYTMKCIEFSLSFLQLYLHEDDLLFRLLLQLLSLPSFEGENIHGERWKCKDVEEDTLLYVSNVFDPIHLFHLFLSELHYDHQVLLDYLISKDTGISCAEYLLRCLRMVCDSWYLFVEFPQGMQLINHSFRKRRKVLSDSIFQTQLPCGSVKNSCLSVGKKPKGNLEKFSDHIPAGEQAYEKAKGCLLSLKTSVENLHQRNLFPYNPKVLLKRLQRFQELCFEQ